METTKQTRARPAPALPTNRALVVQFRSQPEDTALQWAGRVEHVTSGHTAPFASWEQLRQFLAHVLTKEVKEPP
jgi:hypothetical protein